MDTYVGLLEASAWVSPSPLMNMRPDRSRWAFSMPRNGPTAQRLLVPHVVGCRVRPCCLETSSEANPAGGVHPAYSNPPLLPRHPYSVVTASLWFCLPLQKVGEFAAARRTPRSKRCCTPGTYITPVQLKANETHTPPFPTTPRLPHLGKSCLSRLVSPHLPFACIIGEVTPRRVREAANEAERVVRLATVAWLPRSFAPRKCRERSKDRSSERLSTELSTYGFVFCPHNLLLTIYETYGRVTNEPGVTSARGAAVACRKFYLSPHHED